MSTTSPPPPEADEPAEPVRRQQPDLDPGLAPDPEHEVEETPPEGARPTDA